MKSVSFLDDVKKDLTNGSHFVAEERPYFITLKLLKILYCHRINPYNHVLSKLTAPKALWNEIFLILSKLEEAVPAMPKSSSVIVTELTELLKCLKICEINSLSPWKDYFTSF
ncbi:hypothetical protein SK128_014377 [Halocaridina rubra]|uniref:Uncharacterized protein n=1 Tax=Halocaridina rubra TaxID=373956 RepID=A0AAN8X6P4_HALRR